MFKQYGNKRKILYLLEDNYDISSRDALNILTYLENHQYMLSKEECIQKQCNLSNDNSNNVLNLILPNSNYYINIKDTTILIVALICDIKLTQGFVTFALTIAGISTPTLQKLKDEFLCITKEIIKNGRRITFQELQNKFNTSECINNDIVCKHNNNGMCTFNKNNLLCILNDLENTNILNKEENTYLYLI